MLKKIFGHSFLYTIANQIPLLANLIILPIVTPFLTREDYGIYGLLLAYLGAFTAFSTIGIDVLFQNTYFKNKINYIKYWKKYFGILLIWRTIYATILTIILYFLFRNKVNDNITIVLVLVIIPILFFELTKTLGTRYCQYEGKHQYVYINSFVASIFAITASFISIYYFKLGYLGWLISALVSGFIQFIFFTYLIHFKLKIIPNFNNSISFIKKILKISLPIIPHNYSSYLLESSDRVVLDLNKTPIAEIGSYNIAYSFSNYFGTFNNTLNTILSPIYFKCFGLKNKKISVDLVNNITILWFSFILISSLFICLWCKEIFQFLYRNSDLYSAYEYVPFIIIGLLYRPFYVACVDKNIYLENTKSVLKISVGGGILNLILNLVFIPFYGIKAALFSTLISYLYMGFSGFYFKDIKANIDFKYNPLIFITIILLAFFLSLKLLNLDVFYKFIISLIIIVLTGIIYLIKGKQIINELNKENIL